MTSNKQVITDPDLMFRTMDDCPKGPKVLLLNQAGIASTGSWDGKDTWWVGWFPLPKIPPGIRKVIERTHRFNSDIDQLGMDPDYRSNIGGLIGD